MAGPYDATVKALVEAAPADWLALVGEPPAPCRVIDADVATVVGAETDKVLRVDGPQPYLVHLEFQAGHDSHLLPERLARYNILLSTRHRLAVFSTVLVLHRGADSPRLDGEYRQDLPSGRRCAAVWYDVRRVWEMSAEALLQGGLGTLPLAPLAVRDPAQLPGVVARVRERLPDPGRVAGARELWVATYVLLGLTNPADVVSRLLPEVVAMEESSTYQVILERGRTRGRDEGRAEGQLQQARKTLLKLGTHRFGAPDAATRAALEALADLATLDELCERVLDAAGWADLLPPGPPPSLLTGK